MAEIKIDNITNGPVVNQDLETSLDGVFACGNCLQVYDTVDMLSVDAKIAGKNAAKYATIQKQKSKTSIRINPGKGVRYVVPQILDQHGTIHLTLRPEKPGELSTLHVVSHGKELFKKKLPWVNPANMTRVDVKIPAEIISSIDNLEVIIDDR